MLLRVRRGRKVERVEVEWGRSLEFAVEWGWRVERTEEVGVEREVVGHREGVLGAAKDISTVGLREGREKEGWWRSEGMASMRGCEEGRVVSGRVSVSTKWSD